jgi:hypothetical protein
MVYEPSLNDVGTTVTIEVFANDDFHDPDDADICVLEISIVNMPPEISCGLTDAAENTVYNGNEFDKDDIAASDIDSCDLLTFSLARMSGPTSFPVNAPAGDPD